MKKKIVIRMIVDVAMTVILLFLMTYELIGQATHEWIEIAMFAFFDFSEPVIKFLADYIAIMGLLY